MMSGIIEQDEIEDFKDDLYKIEKDILHYDKPKTWNVHEERNMERILEVDFHKFAVQVQEHTGIDISTTSTFTFYAGVEHLKEKFKTK